MDTARPPAEPITGSVTSQESKDCAQLELEPGKVTEPVTRVRLKRQARFTCLAFEHGLGGEVGITEELADD